MVTLCVRISLARLPIFDTLVEALAGASLQVAFPRRVEKLD